MSTHQLETFLKTELAAKPDVNPRLRADIGAWMQHSTVPGIGPGGWDSNTLASAQQQHADRLTAESIHLFKPATPKATAVAYRIYTEDADSLRESLVRLVTRYFEGATITYGDGVWQGQTERAAVVDIIGTTDDLQAVASLAGDIRFVHGQSAVLVTWTAVSQLLLTGDAS